MRKIILVSVVIISLLSFDNQGTGGKLPAGFVALTPSETGIRVELRYAGTRNFTGRPVPGYRCDTVLILTRQAAKALRAVQKDLETSGYGLCVYDAYRPVRSVHHFVRWSLDPADTLTKAAYYPDIPKRELFARGYIAHRSGHSRGSTVDLTLVDLYSGEVVDMGSPFDFFGEISGAYYRKIDEKARKHRALLRAYMRKHGFRAYGKEWWHFTLRGEPYPDTYFDFPVDCSG